MKKIPDHAKKVFEGIIFDVWQWDQELFDGSTAVFEKLSRANTILTIPIVGDKILVSLDEQPDREARYTVPGGRQEKDEIPEQTAKRELLEETGYQSNSIELLFSQDPVNKLEWTIYVYIAKDCKKVAEPELEPGEKNTLELVNFDRFIELMLSDECMETELKLFLYKMQGDYSGLKKKLGI